MKLNILYEDKDIIVVEKPVGMPVQTRNIVSRDMVSELKNYLSAKSKSPNPYLGIIHRLDQPVRGLLVFALNEKAAGSLSRRMSAGGFNKKYHACVEGIVESGEDWQVLIDHLIKDKDTARIVDKDKKDAKRAELKYRTIKTDAERDETLLDIELITGRFHQIRAQLSNMGHPITGDVKYGARVHESGEKEGMGITFKRSIGLCAYQLSFTHPRTGEKMEYHLADDKCT